MDIISHGLYGGVAFGRKNRPSYWLAFFFGIAPDLFSFGILMATIWLGLVSGPDWSSGYPVEHVPPAYVYTLYDWTHSLVIFAAVFGLVWLIRKKPLYEMLGWPLHILVDIPTHSDKFFPTPFLWPLSDFHVDGHPWSDPRIFIPNVIFILVLYLWFYVIRPRRRALQGEKENG